MSRSTAAWRHFKFFEANAVHGAIESLPANLTCTCTYKNVDQETKISVDGLSSCCDNNNAMESPYCIYGDVHGVIHVLDKSGKVTLARFQAYQSAVTHMIYVIEWSILITIGNDTHSCNKATTSASSVNSSAGNKDNDVNVNELSIVRFWRIDQCVSYNHQLIAEEKLFLQEENEKESMESSVESNNANKSSNANANVNVNVKTGNVASSHASLSSSNQKGNNKNVNVDTNISKTKRLSHPLYRPPHTSYHLLSKTSFKSSQPLLSLSPETLCLSFGQQKDKQNFSSDNNNKNNKTNTNNVENMKQKELQYNNNDNRISNAKLITSEECVQTAVVNFDFCVYSELMAIALCTNECVLLRVHLDKLYDNISNSISATSSSSGGGSNNHVYEVQRLHSTIAWGNLTFVALPSPHRVQIQPQYWTNNDCSLEAEIERQDALSTLSNREKQQNLQWENYKMTNTQQTEKLDNAHDAPSRLLESTSSLLKNAWTSAMSPTTLAAMTETFTGKGDVQKNQSHEEVIMMLPHQVVYTVYEDVVSAWSVVVPDMTIRNNYIVSDENNYRRSAYMTTNYNNGNVQFNRTGLRDNSSSNYYKGRYECREWPTALPFGAPLHFACLSSHDTLMLIHLDDSNNINSAYDDIKSQNTAFSNTTTTNTANNIAPNVESSSQEVNKMTLAVLGKRNNDNINNNWSNTKAICVKHEPKHGKHEEIWEYNSQITKAKRAWCDPTQKECVQIIQVTDKSLFQCQISGKSFQQIEMKPARLFSMGNYAIIVSHETTSNTPNVCSMQCYDWQHKLRLLSVNQTLYSHLLLMTIQHKELVIHSLAENVMDTQQEQHIYTTDNNIKEKRSNYDARSEKSTKETNDQQTKYSVIRLREMDLNRKLELLFSREYYALAQSIVDDAVHEIDTDNDINYDESEQSKQLQSSSAESPERQEMEKINSYTTQAIASSNTPHISIVNKSFKRKLSPLQVYVHKCYGDYLFHNERWTEAMTQYIDTIGVLEPSYVIQKYSGVNVQEHLENEYYHRDDKDEIQKVSINNELLVELTRYLEALHHIDCAKDVLDTTYTTLLIHCYLRQQQQQHHEHEQKEQEENDKLLHFIKRNDVRFNALHAIDVCRAHHATRAASTLAKKYALNLLHVNIVLYDEADAHKALELIRMMNVDEAEEALLTMGKDLITAAPRQTTELCTELCVHWSGPPRRLTNLLKTKDSNISSIINTTSYGVTQYEHISKLYETDKVAHRAHANNFIRIFVNSPRCLFHFLRAVIASGVYDDNILTTKTPPQQEENYVSDQGTKNCEHEEEEHNSNIEHSNMINTAMKETDNEDNNKTHYLHNIHGHLYNTLFELYLTPTLQTHLGPDKHCKENVVKVNNSKDHNKNKSNEYNKSSNNVRKECNVVTHNTNNITTNAVDGNLGESYANEEVVNKNNSSDDNTCDYEKDNQIVATAIQRKTIDVTETNATEEKVSSAIKRRCTKTSTIPSEATSEKQSNNNTFPDEPLEQRHSQALQFLHMYKSKYDATWALCLSYQHHFQEGINYLLQEHYSAMEAFQFYSVQLRSIVQHPTCICSNKCKEVNSMESENEESSKDMCGATNNNNNAIHTHDYRSEYNRIRSTLEYMFKICTETERSTSVTRSKELNHTSNILYAKQEREYEEKSNTVRCEELKTMWQTLLIWLAFYTSEFAKYKATPEKDNKYNITFPCDISTNDNVSNDQSIGIIVREQQKEVEEKQMSEELYCLLINVLEHLANSYCEQRYNSHHQHPLEEERENETNVERIHQLHEEQQKEVAQELEEEELHSHVLSVLQPNEVIDLLSANDHLHLQHHIIRLYCERVMEMQENALNNITVSVNYEQEEMVNVQSSLQQCYTTAITFSNSICNTCQMALDAPAVYFMCHHAFHVHCLHNVQECNLCGPADREQLHHLLAHDATSNSHTTSQNNNVSQHNEIDTHVTNNSHDLLQNIVSGVCSTHRLCHHYMKDSNNSNIEEQMSSLLLSSSSSSPNNDIHSCIDYNDWYIDDSVDPTQYEIW